MVDENVGHPISGAIQKVSLFLQVSRMRYLKSVDRHHSSQILSSPNVKVAKTPLAPRKKAKLAERLIQAAVLSHANPTERLRRRRDTAVIGSSRQALQFINEPHTPAKMTSRGRTMTLVDPRRIVPFHKPSFSPHGSPSFPPADSHKHKPVTKWKSSCDGFSYGHEPHIRKIRPSVDRKSSTRVALSFVPLQDAEMTYTSKFSSAGSVWGHSSLDACFLILPILDVTVRRSCILHQSNMPLNFVGLFH